MIHTRQSLEQAGKIAKARHLHFLKGATRKKHLVIPHMLHARSLSHNQIFSII